MAMTDPISDMLTRIRNAQMVGHAKVDFPTSKIKARICEILVEEGYVENVETLGTEEVQATLRVTLKYHNERPVIAEIKRISTPGQRLYVARNEIPWVKQGLGMAIISTSRGVLSSREARRAKVGGEVLCTVF